MKIGWIALAFLVVIGLVEALLIRWCKRNEQREREALDGRTRPAGQLRPTGRILDGRGRADRRGESRDEVRRRAEVARRR